MEMISLPLWLVIVVSIMLSLITTHLIFGDFFAKVFYKLLEKEEKQKKDNQEEK